MAQIRDFEGNKGKRDYYMADPKAITVDPKYNVRDLDTPDALVELAQLKQSIKANGIRVPLRARFDGEKLILVQGHRRLRAVLELIKEGYEIASIPYVPDEKHMSDEDRIVDLVVSNSGTPLTQMEKAEVVRRLAVFGWSDSKIAERLAMSVSGVVDLKTLLSADGEVKEMVRSGKVAAQAAIVAVKKKGTGAKAALDAAASKAKSEGRGRASVRDVAHATGDSSALSKKDVKRLVAALSWIHKNDSEGRFGDRAGRVLADLGLLAADL